MAGKSLNKVMLIGNVTRDPELRYTPQGNAVCQFGLATNRSWKTDSGEMREEAEFHRLVAWNKLAELCSQLCTKGRKIYVEGRLQTRTFTGSDNAQHTITEIVIDDMILLDSKYAQGGGFAGGQQFGQQAGGAPAQQPQQAEPEPQGPAEEAPAAGEETEAKSKGKGKKSAPKAEDKGEEPKAATTESSHLHQDSGGQAGEVKEDVNIDDIPF